jgi:hypothetical protein
MIGFRAQSEGFFVRAFGTCFYPVVSRFHKRRRWCLHLYMRILAGKSMDEFHESFSPQVRHIQVFITHCFRPKLQRLAHLGAVELGGQGWVGANEGIRPALENTCADNLPLG